MKVIYHKDCADGFCAAFLIRIAHPDAMIEFIPAQYGDPLPDTSQWMVGEDVIIADFSWPPEMLAQLETVHDGLITMFDHHKTAVERYDAYGGSSDLRFKPTTCLHFDQGRCGAMLVFEWLLRDTSTADRVREYDTLVRFVQDRDLWQWKLPLSREVSAALASYPKDFVVWKAFTHHTVTTRLCNEGTAVLRYQNALLERIVKHAVIALDGSARVNSCVLQSEIGDALSAGRPWVDVWYSGLDGKVAHSLRSALDGADVSEIAKSHGGGGHKHAAGYVEITQ